MEFARASPPSCRGNEGWSEMSRPTHFDDEGFVKRYVEGPGQFVPGYSAMQQMAAQLVAERVGQSPRILVLGAGGGLEIEAFARLQPSWRFVGVDPSVAMLAEARHRIDVAGFSERVEWVAGLVDDAPRGPFDGATCLLTLHFVPDDGAKLKTLRAIRERLIPGARFVLVDLCIDMAAPDRPMRLKRYERFALDAGADPEDVAATIGRLETVLKLVSPERNEALLNEAGFTHIEPFYAALSWRGWSCTA